MQFQSEITKKKDGVQKMQKWPRSQQENSTNTHSTYESAPRHVV